MKVIMQKKMNILFITSDQQRWDTIGCNNSSIKTPNIDKLFNQGISFNRPYTINPVCTPARATMLTGHYPHKHGCYTIGTTLPEGYPTIPKMMTENGYFTGLIGKAHFQAYHTKGSFESEPNIFDSDFFKKWCGPYYGFQYAKLSAVHSTQKNSTGMHYGIWLKEQGVNTDKYFGRTEYVDFGKWDLPEQYSNSKWVADETINAIKYSENKNKPFYLWASFQDPHNPCFVPEPWASMYNKDEMPVYGLREGEHNARPPFYKAVAEEAYYSDKSKNCYGDEEELSIKNWHCISNLPFMDLEKKKEIMSVYYGMVSQMDHHVGRIIDYLEKAGLLDNTLVVFTSDHGDYMGNHGLWWKGLPAFEDIHKVPFIVSHPQCKGPGKKSDAIQSIVDLGATFLEAAGIDIPVGIQGVSQLNSWLDAAACSRKWAMVEFRPTESPFKQVTYINYRYKLVVYHSRPYGELYDLQKDPDQYNNMWAKAGISQTKNKLLTDLVAAQMETDGKLRGRTSNA